MNNNKHKRILIAGGTGMLGTALIDFFEAEGKEVKILTRHPSPSNESHVLWDAQQLGDWTTSIEWADAVINLCGRSVDCRYTAANRRDIYESRLQPTRVLGLAIQKAKNPPALWLNGASATIYRHADDRPQTEADGEQGHGFSVDVCQRWERLFYGFDLPQTRRVALRTTIVLAPERSALQPMAMMSKLGLGGHQGSGTQMVSWMHVFDFCRAVGFIMEHPDMEGPVNLGSPNPITNRELMRNIRAGLNVPVGLPSPKWLLEIGAFFIQTETELLLKSRWVLPEKLALAGFQWEFATIDKCLADLLNPPFFAGMQRAGLATSG